LQFENVVLHFYKVFANAVGHLEVKIPDHVHLFADILTMVDCYFVVVFLKKFAMVLLVLVFAHSFAIVSVHIVKELFWLIHQVKFRDALVYEFVQVGFVFLLSFSGA